MAVELVRLLQPSRLARLAWRTEMASYLAIVTLTVGVGVAWVEGLGAPTPGLH